MGSFAGQGTEKADLTELTRRLERGDFDLVAVGRALLQDPEWVRKVKEGKTDEFWISKQKVWQHFIKNNCEL
jgi:2,4-dienoyl-CoA reductase-like NADH-dependent reductase (Old Yellow Enzyme family)